MQLVQRAVEVVFVAEALGDACNRARLRRQSSQNVIAVAGGSGLVGERSQLAFGICAGIVNVSYNGRSQRTGLRAVAFAEDAMQFVIAIADGLRGRAGLVGRRRSLLQQIAVGVVGVRDRSGLRIVGREQARERIISKRAGTPLRAVCRRGAFLVSRAADCPARHRNKKSAWRSRDPPLILPFRTTTGPCSA